MMRINPFLLIVCLGGCGLPAKDGAIAVKDALCVIDRYSLEIEAGKSMTDAVAEAALACGVPQDIASVITAEHHIAAEREQRAAAKLVP